MEHPATTLQFSDALKCDTAFQMQRSIDVVRNCDIADAETRRTSSQRENSIDVPPTLKCVMTGDSRSKSSLLTRGNSGDAGMSLRNCSDRCASGIARATGRTADNNSESIASLESALTLPLVLHCKKLMIAAQHGVMSRDDEAPLITVLGACAMLQSCDHVAFFQRVRLRWKRSEGRNIVTSEVKLPYEEVAPPRKRDYSPFSASGSSTNPAGKTVPVLLPPQQGVPRKTLVLDLDETLIRSIPIEPFDLQSGSDDDEGDMGSQAIRHGFLVECPAAESTDDVNDASTTPMYVHCRPQLESFLSQVSALFEVVVFSSRGRQYTNAILDRIDSNHRLIQHRLYHEHCLHDNTEKNICVKDISLLGRSLDQVVIVDDTPMNYIFQPYNAIPVPAWLADDATDVMLPDLMTLLREIASASTVYDVLDDLTGAYCRRQTVAGFSCNDISN